MASLLDQLDVKGYQLNNRIVLPPMATDLANEDGSITEKNIDHYVKRAPGQGLLIVEHNYINPQGKFSEGQIGIHEDRFVEGLSQLYQAITDQTTVAVQLNHAGLNANQTITDLQPVAPSTADGARELELDELGAVKDDFVQAARRAAEAGFDGVEIHGAHGFLLNEFFSPVTNLRDDKYGGELENRVRFPLEVVQAVGEILDEQLLLYRLGADDLRPNGNTVRESTQFAKMLEDAGIDILDVSGGVCGSRPEELAGEQGYFVSQAASIREEVGIPVIGVGGITEPTYANQVINEDLIDLVAVGRAQLSDPQWAVKAIDQLE